MFPKSMDVPLPQSVADAVDVLLGDLQVLDRTRLGAMDPDELDQVNRVVGLQIARDFRLWSGNDALLADCLALADTEETTADPTMVIIHTMWRRLQETHVLRIVKP